LLVHVETAGYTRNGLLSSKKHEDGSEEVIFSYVDVVNELSAQSFLYIIINFVETAAILRSKLQLLMTLKEHQQGMSLAFNWDAYRNPTKSTSKDNPNLIPFQEEEIATVASGRSAAGP
jgi:hypothetical protein